MFLLDLLTKSKKIQKQILKTNLEKICNAIVYMYVIVKERKTLQYK
jgi:hypothetical protein